MLSDDDKARIRLEEETAALARLERQARPRRARARRAYRARVRGQLRPFNPFWLLLGALALAAGVGVWAWPRAALPDDASGGIANSLFTLRCAQELRAQLQDPDLHLPSPREAATQMTASPDGKRWDGWADGPTGRTDFSCEYTPATDSITLEVISQGAP